MLTAGSTTSHVAMLARSRGIPAVVGLGVDLAELSGEALVDAHRGVLIVNPGPAARAQFERDAQAAAAARTLAAAAAHAAGRDRRRHADPDHAQHRRSARARRISIRRSATASGSSEPSSCSTTGKGCPTRSSSIRSTGESPNGRRGRPVTIRTLDAGGDKPIPGLTPAGESNPFLGVRGLAPLACASRCLSHAIARAGPRRDARRRQDHAADGDAAAASSRLRAACSTPRSRHWRAAGIAARRASLGIMIEVPAAAIAADQFDAEFFSIGSNDLTQYVAAAGRDIGAVADLADPTQPAMLRLLPLRRRRARARNRSRSAFAATPAAILAPFRCCSPRDCARCRWRRHSWAARNSRSRPSICAPSRNPRHGRDEAGTRARGCRRRVQSRAETRSRHAPVRNAPSSGDRAGKEPFVHLADRQSGIRGADPGTAPRDDFRDLPLHRRRPARVPRRVCASASAPARRGQEARGHAQGHAHRARSGRRAAQPAARRNHRRNRAPPGRDSSDEEAEISGGMP